MPLPGGVSACWIHRAMYTPLQYWQTFDNFVWKYNIWLSWYLVYTLKGPNVSLRILQCSSALCSSTESHGRGGLPWTVAGTADICFVHWFCPRPTKYIHIGGLHKKITCIVMFPSSSSPLKGNGLETSFVKLEQRKRGYIVITTVRYINTPCYHHIIEKCGKKFPLAGDSKVTGLLHTNTTRNLLGEWFVCWRMGTLLISQLRSLVFFVDENYDIAYDKLRACSQSLTTKWISFNI